MRFLIQLLVVVALIFGVSHASAIIFWAMGSWSAVGFEQDGSQTHMQFGENLPRPEWVPFYPGASIVTGSKLTRCASRPDFIRSRFRRAPRSTR